MNNNWKSLNPTHIAQYRQNTGIYVYQTEEKISKNAESSVLKLYYIVI